MSERRNTGNRVNAGVDQASRRTIGQREALVRDNRCGDGVGGVGDEVAIRVANLNYRLNVQVTTRGGLVYTARARNRLRSQRDVIAVAEGQGDSGLLCNNDRRVGGRERDCVGACRRATEDQAREGRDTRARRHLSAAHQASAGRSCGSNHRARLAAGVHQVAIAVENLNLGRRGEADARASASEALLNSKVVGDVVRDGNRARVGRGERTRSELHLVCRARQTGQLHARECRDTADEVCGGRTLAQARSRSIGERQTSGRCD